MRIYERNGWYYLDVRVEGVRHRAALGTRDKKEALKLAAAAIEEWEKSPEIAEVPAVPLKEATELMIAFKRNSETQKAYGKSAKRLCEKLGENFDLANLSADIIEQYIDERTLQGIKAHTIHKELVVLRQSYKRAFPKTPFPFRTDFKAEYEPRKRFLTGAEASQLLAVASDNASVWIMLGLYAGAEPAAIRRTRWNDVDFDEGWIQMHGTKGVTRDRMIPLSEPLAEFLKPRNRTKPLVPGWANPFRDLEKWCPKAKIDHCCRTDFRRTFGSWLKQAGVDSKTVADLMGHASTAMVDKVYGQLNADAYKRAVGNLKKLPMVAV